MRSVLIGGQLTFERDAQASRAASGRGQETRFHTGPQDVRSATGHLFDDATSAVRVVRQLSSVGSDEYSPSTANRMTARG